jgi:outer membrane translocation and assembly module TamA
MATGNLELRSAPVAIKALRLAAVVFWDMGHAAGSFSELDLHHDVGFGLRTLLPQDSRFINRFDWAFPINGDPWPGRFSFSFDQFF